MRWENPQTGGETWRRPPPRPEPKQYDRWSRYEEEKPSYPVEGYISGSSSKKYAHGWDDDSDDESILGYIKRIPKTLFGRKERQPYKEKRAESIAAGGREITSKVLGLTWKSHSWALCGLFFITIILSTAPPALAYLLKRASESLADDSIGQYCAHALFRF